MRENASVLSLGYVSITVGVNAETFSIASFKYKVSLPVILPQVATMIFDPELLKLMLKVAIPDTADTEEVPEIALPPLSLSVTVELDIKTLPSSP